MMEQLAQNDRVAEPAIRIVAARLGRAIDANPRPLAVALLLAGLVVRLFKASGTYLNPDEAMHLLAANQSSWWLTYKASLTLAHPPLLILLLHLWRGMGRSELILRMPVILAGTAACWLAYRWLAGIFGEGVGATALVFMLFLPSSIQLSAELRQYALLVVFEVGAAHLLEVALAKNSVRAMLSSAACLCLALLSHYSAFLVAAVLGTYALIRMLHRRPPLRIVAAWEASQITALSLCYFLYVSHLSTLGRNFGGASALRGFMGDEYLNHSYFVPGKINPLVFVFARTGGVFQYLFGQSVVGDFAYVAFVAGFVLAFSRWRGALLRRAELVCLLLFPFAATCAAALARAYPYGGTRHCFFLLPFAVTGVAVAVLAAVRGRVAGGILTALFVAGVCNLFLSPRSPYLAAESQSRRHMSDAIDFLRQVGPETPIFADGQTSFLLAHYLCTAPVTFDARVEGFVGFECGGRRVIVARTFIFTYRSLRDQWQLMLDRYRLAPGARVWVAEMGWLPHSRFELSDFPGLHLEPHHFGNNLEVFQLTAGQAMPAPELLPNS
ncbi:MAG: glycosyltransferase family 39 protein [Acidobacteria bacterium]|nr:glycosyltransferase family 39 protein [Acidobacteriota bacterium]